MTQKIFIITIHCIHNFGSVFQSYALVEYLRNNGYKAEIIDYRPDYYSKGRNALKSYVSKLLNLSPYLRQHARYNKFIEEEIPKTAKVYRTIADLKEFGRDDAIFIAGGDQIWNSFHPCGRDDAYKLTFVEAKPKLAFGTSMGRNTFSSEELKALTPKLSDFQTIGLRELSTVEMLQPYVKAPVSHVCDPVLLLEKDAYSRFVGKEPVVKEPYLLMYLADKSDLLEETVSSLAERMGLKVVHVCGFRKKCQCDYFLKDTGPEDLLNLIYHSSFVVSASFHATLFSLLFEKQFCTLLPEAGTNTRIEDLLGFFGVSDRIICTSADLKNLNVNINFDQVTPALKQFASESKQSLDVILKNCSK